jgi:hypothetical protein
MSNETPVTQERLAELIAAQCEAFTYDADIASALRELQSLRASAAKGGDVKCETCGGSGRKPHTVASPCPDCAPSPEQLREATDATHALPSPEQQGADAYLDCPKCGDLEQHQSQCLVEQQGAEQPVAYLHRIVEPGQASVSDNTLFSYSAENPWSHWVERHRRECVWTCTPLYSTAPAPASGLTQDQRMALLFGARELEASASYAQEPYKAEMMQFASTLRSLLERGGK